MRSIRGSRLRSLSLSKGVDLELSRKVFFVGENGSGHAPSASSAAAETIVLPNRRARRRCPTRFAFHGYRRSRMASSCARRASSTSRGTSRPWILILDEPETALSPQRQLALLKILHDLEGNRRTPFPIATHSPILLLYLGAQVDSLDSGRNESVDPEDTEHVKLTRDFLRNAATYFHALFGDD